VSAIDFDSFRFIYPLIGYAHSPKRINLKNMIFVISENRHFLK